MAEVEKLRADVDTLKESIQRDWVDMATKPMTKEERADLRQHIRLCIKEMKQLVQRLDENNA